MGGRSYKRFKRAFLADESFRTFFFLDVNFLVPDITCKRVVPQAKPPRSVGKTCLDSMLHANSGAGGLPGRESPDRRVDDL